MGMSWTDSVKRRGQLVISAAGSAMGGGWGPIVRQAVNDFNSLSRRNRLGVAFAFSTGRGDAGGNADVVIRTGHGNISCSHDSATVSEQFSGYAMHGRTFTFSRNNRIEKAFVFLPLQPRVNTPRGMRPVGPGVKKVIAAHELVHVCGLSNAEHSNNDLFIGFPSVDPGNTPAQDRVSFYVGSRRRTMPPLIIAASTCNAVRSLWRTP